MPPKPIFASERQRQFGVAGAMLALLLASVGAATLYAHAHQSPPSIGVAGTVQVGDLTLAPGPHWRPDAVESRPNQAVLRETTGTHRVLIVTALTSRSRLAAALAHAAFLRSLRPWIGDVNWVKGHPFAHTVQGIEPQAFENDPDDDADQHVIVVFLDADLKHCFAICLVTPVLDAPSQPAVNRRVIDELLATVRLRGVASRPMPPESPD